MLKRDFSFRINKIKQLLGGMASDLLRELLKRLN